MRLAIVGSCDFEDVHEKVHAFLSSEIVNKVTLLVHRSEKGVEGAVANLFHRRRIPVVHVPVPDRCYRKDDGYVYIRRAYDLLDIDGVLFLGELLTPLATRALKAINELKLKKVIAKA